MKQDFRGLDDSEVLKSREKHGDNSLTKEKNKGFLRRFFENLNDPIIKVLIIALVIEVIFTFRNCNFFELFGIVAAILIATTVSTVSEYGSERAFQKIDGFRPDQAIIIGDSLTSDIKGGINAGIKTCYFNRGGARPEGIRPGFEIRRLSELELLLENL